MRIILCSNKVNKNLIHATLCLNRAKILHLSIGWIQQIFAKFFMWMKTLESMWQVIKIHSILINLRLRPQHGSMIFLLVMVIEWCILWEMQMALWACLQLGNGLRTVIFKSRKNGHLGLLKINNLLVSLKNINRISHLWLCMDKAIQEFWNAGIQCLILS